jgi:Flp pilus assembly protein TadG
MRNGFSVLWEQAQQRARNNAASWKRNEDGATAIEFAMVALPFLMMLFGIIAVGLFFFTTFSLENAVEQASRPMKTGEAQQANNKTGKTKAEFKAEVCSLLPAYVDCTGKLRINVQKYNDGDMITPPACVDAGGNLVGDAGTPFNPGARKQIMLVTGCLEWALAGQIPFLQLGSMSNGAAMLQASTTFKTEPF